MHLPAVLPSATLWYAFEASDAFGRTIVVILFILSIYVWTIMIERGITMSRARRAGRRFQEAFNQADAPLELALRIEEFKGPLARVYMAGVDEVMDVLRVDPKLVDAYCRRRTLPRPLTPYEIDKVRTTVERTVANELMRLESRVGLVGTSVSLSPFLGLLGTVWGVLMTFCEMARLGRMDIEAVAPGVSGALLTTVAGLFVAIPALIGYNLIVNSLQKSTVEMDNFTDHFVALLKLESHEER